MGIKVVVTYLTQSTHRKIQQLGSENVFRVNEELMLFCGQVDSLAFLPISDVFEEMSYLRKIMLKEANDLVEYFDQIYITGTCRCISQGNTLTFRIIPHPFLQ